MPAEDRRLAAIMFTDIVGYTRMTQAKERLALELLEEHRTLVRPILQTYGGTEVKTIGDAFLVEFRSALEAVECAVDIQKKLAERNSEVSPERNLQVRVGVHVGDVVHTAGDVYGDAVNVASRVEPLAQPGGVCITQQVYDSVRNKTELGFTKMGDIELKNVELPVTVYKVEPTRSSGMGQTQAPRERVAVLPFVNISPDPNDEFFADGLTEELISKLSEVRGLKVIARTSVMNYKKKEKNVSQIGRELEVGSIIEGSVRKAGNKIRVTVQLIDAGTEEHLWASNYDKELDDIFAIQSDVAAKVAGSVSAGLLTHIAKPNTTDIDAYTMYLRAVQLSHEGRENDLREAIGLLDRAIKRDPSFARAHAALAQAWVLSATSGYDSFDVISTHAEPAVRKALELDPNSAEAHGTLSHIASALDRFDEMLREANTALALNPNLADAHFSLGIASSTNGKLDQGLVSLEKAYELDPLSYKVVEILALVSRVAGRGQRSKEILERFMNLNPNNQRVYAQLADYHMVNGEYDEAQELIDKGFAISPGDAVVRFEQALLFALTGKRKEAEEALELQMKENSDTVRLYSLLFVSAAFGDMDRAFETLDKQAAIHSWPFLIGSLPIFAELRKDPRYAQFAKKVGIPA